MNGPRLSYEAQIERVEELIVQIDQAFQARDFPRLIRLANRLATDGVIAGALSNPRSKPKQVQTAHAA